jgi:light-independent protochlorophyllide reductase subunit L
VAAIQAKGQQYKVRLGGIVANRSTSTDQIDKFNDAVGLRTMARIPDLDAVRRSRLKKCTLFEMEESDEVLAVRETYMDLARTMANGVDGLMPDPLSDDRIFNLLGFD